MKTDETKQIELGIFNATCKQGVFGCFEVTIGWFGKERVDYMTYDTKGIFRCYEIKVTKADFHSPCHNSFVGNFNYYVLPIVLYEQVKDEIPNFVGVYVIDNKSVYSVKNAKRKAVGNSDVLKDSMIRSLSREVSKQIRNGDPLKIESLNREIGQLKNQRNDYQHQYWDLLREVQERYGTRWNRDIELPENSNAKKHELKILPKYFRQVKRGIKKFELRKNDRGYEVGDYVKLCEHDGAVYTGESIQAKITYVLNYEDAKEFGLCPGYCIFGFEEKN